MLNRSYLFILISIFTATATSVFANNTGYGTVVNVGVPCNDGGGKIPVDDEQVLSWKKTTANKYLDRGHINGNIIASWSRPSHHHFIVQIGNNLKGANDYCNGDAIEVIYNRVFGEVIPADLKAGGKLQACGDYITANAKNGRYDPSPACAILHWVHMNARGGGHDDGYLYINGHMYGRTYDASKEIKKKRH